MAKIFKNIFKTLMSRLFIISLFILVQMLVVIFAFRLVFNLGVTIVIVFEVLKIIVVVMILNRDFNPAYKITWIIFVLLIPLAGAVFYLIFGRVRISKKLRRRMNNIINKNSELLTNDPSIIQDLDDDMKKLSTYIKNASGMQAFQNTKTEYLRTGEEFFKALKYELKNAKKFIFLEYYIIEEGRMWNQVLDILIKKAEAGVDVRLMYDDFGCVRRLPYNFKKRINKTGIQVCNFNPFVPKISTFMNYRDHRKITVIDGNVGFTGGVNLADEYINAVKLFGYWKDTAIMIKGQAVWNLTSLFLENWEFSTGISEDYQLFKPTKNYPSDGVVHVFGDSPFDGHITTENTYINIINNAKKYVYITTPYLIIDNELISALKTSAVSGVDVRIITPNIPDKKVIFYLTQSYYKDLIRAGVKIYQYLPGFLHAKSIVSDDNIAVVGTVNLDFRSLYLHFEVSCLLFKTKSIEDIILDFQDIIDVSKQITYKDTQEYSIFKKMIAFLLKAIAPTM